MTARIELIYFNAGGGHRAAAQALDDVMQLQGRPWRVERVNLMDVLDPAGVFKRLTGMAPEDIYNKRLASGFTLGLAQELKLLQGLIRLGHAAMVDRLARRWQETRPDLVVSLLPNFNRALHDGLARARPAAPFVTVMTDLADHPPNFWIEPGCAQHLVCGTAHAAAQALAAGCHPRYVHRASGMILRPGFHFPTEGVDRDKERQRVGLDVHTPTGLVLFGGAGSSAMLRIAERLPHTPLILICGRHPTLADELRAASPKATAPRVVLGHTHDVPRWMRLADFFIGKPGPGSLSEAVHMGLPVIVTRNAGTMPQERWNTQWVREHGLGVVERSFRNVGTAVEHLTQALPAYQANVRRMANRALFEVPQIIEHILAQQPAATRRAQGPQLAVV